MTWYRSSSLILIQFQAFPLKRKKIGPANFEFLLALTRKCQSLSSVTLWRTNASNKPVIYRCNLQILSSMISSHNNYSTFPPDNVQFPNQSNYRLVLKKHQGRTGSAEAPVFWIRPWLCPLKAILEILHLRGRVLRIVLGYIFKNTAKSCTEQMRGARSQT